MKSHFNISLLLSTLLLLLACPRAEGAYEITSHDILLELDLEEHSLKATDMLNVRLGEIDIGHGSQDRTVTFLLNKHLHIESIRTGTKDLEWRRPNRGGPEGADIVEVYIPASLMGPEVLLRFSYHGILYEPLEVYKEPAATITPEFVYLTPRAHWYADLPNGSLSTFRVETRIASGYEVVTHGKPVERKEDNNMTLFVWDADYPSDNCFLVAARYLVTHDTYDDIDLYTFFFPEEQELSKSYIDATKRYLRMYEEMFGPYPFSKFAVVENLFPTGYGMPSYTLLGRAALKLPFIVHISLGHEVAHSWWGNSVFTHPEHGNWCEGLTTYVADYHYKELINSGSAMEYRRDILRTYANHMYDEIDFALEGFTEGGVPRTDKAVRSVLYGKCAMVFHMLKGLVGPETFSEALKSVYRKRRWKQTTWDDFRRIFEEVSGRDLGWFFRQWVFEKGAPLLQLDGARVVEVEKGGPYRVNLKLSQKPPAYRLTVPVTLVTADGKKSRHQLEMHTLQQEYSLPSESRPSALYIDPEADVFRRLLPEEIPPTLDKALGDREMLVIYPTQGSRRLMEEYIELAPHLKHHAPAKSDAEVTEDDLHRGLFLLGCPDENIVVKRLLEAASPPLKFEDGAFVLNETRYNREGSALLFCFANPFKRGRGICLFFGPSPDAVRAVGRKLAHYGRYSYVVFVDNVSADKGVFPKTVDPLSIVF